MNNLKKDFISFMRNEGIFTDMFESFIKNKAKEATFPIEEGWYGCFPILDESNILIDVRLLVPKIVDEKTLLVNVHEFMHAKRMYDKLGQIYQEDVELEEFEARKLELLYLKSRV